MAEILKRKNLAIIFLEWKLRKLLLIYKILFKQCEKSISKRLLLHLISLQILQITSSNETKNGQNYEEQQQKNKINNKTIIEMQNKLIEYIISKNSNLNNKTTDQTKLVSFLKSFNKNWINFVWVVNISLVNWIVSLTTAALYIFKLGIPFFCILIFWTFVPHMLINLFLEDTCSILRISNHWGQLKFFYIYFLLR